MRYNEGKARYNEGKARYNEGKARYNEGKARYNEGKARYNEGKARYNEARYNEGGLYQLESNSLFLLSDCSGTFNTVPRYATTSPLTLMVSSL